MPHEVHLLRDLFANLDPFVTRLFTAGIRIVFLLTLAIFLRRAIKLLTNKFGSTLQGFSYSPEQQKRAQTLSSIARSVATAVLVGVTILLLLEEIGIDIAPLLAAAGIGGLAIGFGAQNLVRDIISGFFMLLEDQVRVGDTVKVGDKSGQVEGIGLRILTLRDFDGSIHMIPNGTITMVTNMTKDYSYSVLRVTVPAREDMDAAMKVLREIGNSLRQESAFAPQLLADLEIVGIDELTGSYATITIRFKTVPGGQWRITRELRRRIKKAFDDHNIEIA